MNKLDIARSAGNNELAILIGNDFLLKKEKFWENKTLLKLVKVS